MVKATRALLNLNDAARRIGCRPGVLLTLAERCPSELPTEHVDGARYFNAGDVDRLANDVLLAFMPALEGR